ncbi:Thiol peroxidase, Bcp type [Mucinivorans hirudinis]|uniref:thioredoxin-dependent peroxiredoxin n=1 Tax=Mucinivorans hirudinis TaxID=1433126 RepID=A0A060RCI0_9BACT|nr:Thiol peroxidase, Bcp type [Mucinivorans hirudinis]
MLQVNDKAPLWEGVDQNDDRVSLGRLLEKGKKVVLYFYPKDSTPGCTAEACSLRDGHSDLIKQGYTVVGVSPDSTASHRKFIEKQSLPFTLIADTDHSIAEAYGVWGLKKFMGREYMGILRATFIINTEGIIEKVFENVDTKNHYQQIINK